MCTLCRAVQRRVVESKPEERFARADHLENFGRRSFMSRITECARNLEKGKQEWMNTQSEAEAKKARKTSMIWF